MTDESLTLFVEDLLDYLTAQEAAIVALKMQIAKLFGPAKEDVAVKEETFTCLKFEPQKGEKLGDFETATQKNNIPDKWNSAFNILRKDNSTINNRYHGEGYQFSYWIYGDRIFRQVLKRK